jgi:hypothetical protein
MTALLANEIMDELRANGYNMTQAAKSLGISQGWASRIIYKHKALAVEWGANKKATGGNTGEYDRPKPFNVLQPVYSCGRKTKRHVDGTVSWYDTKNSCWRRTFGEGAES